MSDRFAGQIVCLFVVPLFSPSVVGVDFTWSRLSASLASVAVLLFPVSARTSASA